MFHAFWRNTFGRLKRKQQPARKIWKGGVSFVRASGGSYHPAVTASFSANTGILSVFGDSLNNNIAVSRDAAGQILVKWWGCRGRGRSATVANTSLIQCSARVARTPSLWSRQRRTPGCDALRRRRQRHLDRRLGQRQLFGQAATTPCSARAASTCSLAATATTP